MTHQLASVICYLRSIQIKCTNPGEHLLLSSIEKENAKKTETAKKCAPAKKDVSLKKTSRKQSSGVQIRDTLGVSVSKKKVPATTDRSKGIDLLSEAALLEDAQMKKVLKRGKRETCSHQSSGLGDGVDSQPKVPDELQDKTIGTNKGTGTKPGVPDVPKDQSASKNKSWGESGDDDDSNDDVSDDDGNDDDSDDDGNNDVSDDEKTESDDHQNDDDKEKEYEEEYARTPENDESTEDESKHVDEEEYDRIDEELYKDVNVELKDAEHGEEGKGDAEMTDVGHDDVTQETTYDQVEDDIHVTLTVAHVTQKTKVSL
ncbi:hypothetical protein Tco_0074265 [Tanacetum coccineum]